MMGKGLLAFLAIIAITFDSAAAVFKGCSKQKNCKKCLKQTANGCAWNAGPDSPGECIDKEECNDKGRLGECFFGNDAGNNDYACGISCKTQSDSTCNNCLDYVVFGASNPQNGGKIKSDCSWFVNAAGEGQCIYRKQCADRGFDIGTCTAGKKNRDNTKKCADTCETRDGCKKCLKAKNGLTCAFYVDGGETKCVDEDRCGERGFETGECYKGSEIVGGAKKTCRAIKDTPEEKSCTDLSGCKDCLTTGCYWINDLKECVDSCKDAPADVGCSGTTPPIDPNDRSLLRFESEADMMCFNYDIDDQNDDLCQNASTGGCETCVTTNLIIPPGVFYIRPPTCMYFPTGKRCASKAGMAGDGVITCSPDSVVPGPWDTLLGRTVDDAKRFFEENYGTDLKIEVVVEGSFVTEDYVITRVRLWVDKETENIVVEIPRVG